MRGIARKMRQVAHLHEDSRGALLIEVLIALAILGLISVVFIGAMYTSLQAARITQERSNALTLAKSQMEFVKAREFSTVDNWDYIVTTSGWSATTAPSWLEGKPSDYVRLPNEYEDYQVEVQGTSDIDIDDTIGPDEGIRTITAIVRHLGDEVTRLQNYEVDR